MLAHTSPTSVYTYYYQVCKFVQYQTKKLDLLLQCVVDTSCHIPAVSYMAAGCMGDLPVLV